MGGVVPLGVAAFGLSHTIGAGDRQRQRIVDALQATGMVRMMMETDAAHEGQAGTLPGRVGERRQPFDGIVQRRPGPELFDRLGAIEQQVEGRIGLSARQLDGRGLAGRHRASRGCARAARPGVRPPPDAALPPLRRPRTARWCASRAALAPCCARCAATRACSTRAIGCGQQAMRGLADQVVHEAACIEQALTLERMPRIGQLEHIAPAHRRGQLGVEVVAGNGGDAHHQQAIGRQRDQPLFEQLGHPRRGFELVGAQVAVLLERVADGFEQVQRIAADAPHQRRRDGRRIDQRQRQRFDEGLHRAGTERLQRYARSVAAPGQAGDARRRDVAVDPRGEAEAQAGQRGPGQQLLPGVDAGVVGKLQVVEHEGDQPLPARRSQQVDQDRRHRLHRRRLPLAGARHLRDEACVGRHGAELGPALAQAMHEAVERGQRHLVVTRPGAQHQHAGLRFGHGIEQPALAHSRLTGDDEEPLRRPGVGQLGQFGGAADELRRAQRRSRQGLAGQPGVRKRLLDGLQQRHRLAGRAAFRPRP